MTSATDKIIKLYKYESFLYFLLWTGAVLYSIYKVFLINSCKNLSIYFMSTCYKCISIFQIMYITFRFY